MKNLTAVMTGIAAGSLLTIGVAPAIAAHDEPSPVVTWISKRPCAEEDSVNCAWNAKEQGNGYGHSFIVRQMPGSKGMVCVLYAQRKFARHHDYCS